MFLIECLMFKTNCYDKNAKFDGLTPKKRQLSSQMVSVLYNTLYGSSVQLHATLNYFIEKLNSKFLLGRKVLAFI